MRILSFEVLFWVRFPGRWKKYLRGENLTAKNSKCKNKYLYSFREIFSQVSLEVVGEKGSAMDSRVYSRIATTVCLFFPAPGLILGACKLGPIDSKYRYRKRDPTERISDRSV